MEVLLADVLFDDSITHLPPADVAALLSSFVCDSGIGGGGGGGGGNSANILQSTQGATRVALVSGEELVTQPAKDSLENDNLPTFPDHLKDIVKCMLKKANQVYACVCVYREPG